MRALIVSSVASMIDQFCMNSIHVLKRMGYEVHVACNFDNPGTITLEKCILLKKELDRMNVKHFQVDFSRKVSSIKNHMKSLKQIKTILNEGGYCLLHCHSPIGGMISRIAAKGFRKRTGLKVIYTAHGFHFYKGAPFKNWIMYYPLEKKCLKWTDVLITINREDYNFALKKMKAKKIIYMPGVGVDVTRFANTTIDVAKKRREIAVPEKCFLIFSVGELNINKNHQSVIKAIALKKDGNIHYAIAGVGPEKDSLIKLAEELKVNLHLLGYRRDVAELYKTADLFVLPSLREGLNVSLMEAIASGCKVIASNIRGNVDLIPTSNLFDPCCPQEIANLICSNDLPNVSCDINFDSSNIEKELESVYSLN